MSLRKAGKPVGEAGGGARQPAMLRSMLGVRFRCKPGCTRCCDRQGYVYLTRKDLENAARHTGMTTAEFERRYVYRTRHLLRLRKPRRSQCHFLVDGGCSIHPVKPVQCRLFPFWPELLEDTLVWRKTAALCPGIGTGRLIQIGTAHETASEMKRAYPSMYEE
jgi:hypothetical protein